MRMTNLALAGLITAFALSNFCVATLAQESSNVRKSFREDLEYLKSHTPIVLLGAEGAAVAVAPTYQGRVLTDFQKATPAD